MSSIVAARIYAFFSLAVIVFEIALAAGIPWGEIAWGGAYKGQLPMEMRVASVFSALLLFVMLLIVWTRAGFILQKWQSASRKLVWVIVIYSILGVVANAITPSVWERIIWLPVAIVMLVCSTVVATKN